MNDFRKAIGKDDDGPKDLVPRSPDPEPAAEAPAAPGYNADEQHASPDPFAEVEDATVAPADAPRPEADAAPAVFDDLSEVPTFEETETPKRPVAVVVMAIAVCLVGLLIAIKAVSGGIGDPEGPGDNGPGADRNVTTTGETDTTPTTTEPTRRRPKIVNPDVPDRGDLTKDIGLPTKAERAAARKLLNRAIIQVISHDHANALRRNNRVFAKHLEFHLGVKVIPGGRPDPGVVSVQVIREAGFALVQTSAGRIRLPLIKVVPIKKVNKLQQGKYLISDSEVESLLDAARKRVDKIKAQRRKAREQIEKRRDAKPEVKRRN